jgi:hypothetical protein
MGADISSAAGHEDPLAHGLECQSQCLEEQLELATTALSGLRFRARSGARWKRHDINQSYRTARKARAQARLSAGEVEMNEHSACGACLYNAISITQAHPA